MQTTPSTAETSIQRGTAVFAGLAVALVALGLRWPQIGESLWLDELHTAWCVTGSWSDVAPRANIGNQSPLYFWLVRLVVSVFGPSELSLRMPSLVSGLALIAVVGMATARWTSSAFAGLFAATLVAIDRNCIFYSQEARPYALLQLVAWCHAALILQMVENPTPTRRAFFSVGALAQFYLHYTSTLFLAGEVVFLLDAIIKRRGPDTYRWRQLAVDLTVVAVGCSPAAYHITKIAARRVQWEQFVLVPKVGDFFQLLRLDLYLLPAITLIVLANQWHRRSRSPVSSGDAPNKLGFSLVCCLLLVPTVCAWILTRRHLAAVFFQRYLVSSLVAAPIGAALLCRSISTGWVRATAAAVTVAASIWASGMPQQWRFDGRFIGDRRQDWRGAIEFVNRNASRSRDVCFVRSGYVEADLLRSAHDKQLEEFCLAPVNSLYQLQIDATPLPFSRAGELDVRDPNGRTLLVDASKNLWFIVNGSSTTRKKFVTDVEQFLRGQPRSASRRQYLTFGDILVCQFAWHQPTSPSSITAP